MVGIGQVTGGGSRWGAEFIDPVVSVYEGAYDKNVLYDATAPIETLELDDFGGVHPTPYPPGGTRIVRGSIKVAETGVYEMRPGYAGSTYNIMEIDGEEVYRREPGGDAVYQHIQLNAGELASFKITYLTENANGLGWIARVDIPGTLATLVQKEGKFPYLLDEEGRWETREDVWYKGLVTAAADQWLSVGCGANSNSIGPELGFGHVVGEHHQEPVILLKTSQGNRSLAWDFLPPGSERFIEGGRVYAGYKDSPATWEVGSEPKPINWYAGKQYDDCFQAVHELLGDFDKSFPLFAGRGFKIAGFVWWQGHKDQGNPVHAGRYERNLVHLIKTLRREFSVPKAPFVVGSIGFDGRSMSGNALTVAEAQLAVDGGTGKHPEFKGNVAAVDTRDFWRDAERSPRNQGFHYNQNAETYMLVGEALGKAMVSLQKQASASRSSQR